ncbi:MAG: glycosyltransferase family 4 protein [Betaproteobacteria bacterium]|nr:glycosyltransferase family 4 protein [Betaproteobacteria bacterium]
MKILHTEASCGWGGQEIRILSEASGLMARGHGLQIICPAEACIYEEGKKRGIPTTALPIGRKNLNGLLAMRRWLASHPVDLLNSHSSTDSWLAALALATLPSPPPLVRTRHISAPVSGNFATHWLYTRATAHIVTTGERLRESLIAENTYPATQITSVPTGIDTEWFRPPEAGERAAARAALGLPENALLIGIVATLRDWKGHQYLIEAFAQQAGALDRPDRPARLVIVGDGPQRRIIVPQIQSLGLAERIVMPGNREDVRPWLHAFDLFALPSYANEGVPQALMQALACGLPAVTTDVGSIGELTRDQAGDETALVVPPENSAALGEALIRLATNEPLRQRLGAKARAHIAAHFNRETMLDRMEGIFRRVVGQGCKP